MFQDKLKIGARCNGVLLALVSVLLLGPAAGGVLGFYPHCSAADKR